MPALFGSVNEPPQEKEKSEDTEERERERDKGGIYKSWLKSIGDECSIFVCMYKLSQLSAGNEGTNSLNPEGLTKSYCCV